MLRRWWSGRAAISKLFLIVALPVHLLGISVLVYWTVSGPPFSADVFLLLFALFGLVLILGIPPYIAQRRHDLDAIVRRAWAEEAADAARSSQERDRPAASAREPRPPVHDDDAGLQS